MKFFGCSRLPARSQKLSAKMIANAVVQVRSCRLSGNTVRLARVHLQVKLLARVNKRIHHLDGVLDVHVVITGAVYFQQMPVQFFGKVDG